MKFKKILGLALAAAATSAVATTFDPPILVAFKLNPALIISMVNVAQQNNGVVTEYPANMNPAVLQVSVTNNSSQVVTPCFKIEIREPGRAVTCADDPSTPMNEATSPETLITHTGVITSKVAIQPGTSRLLSAADFFTSGALNGSVNACFGDEFEGDFQSGMDPAKLQKAVERIRSKRFQVCLQQVDCGGGSPIGTPACDFFNIFAQQPGVTSSVPIIVYPHNNRVPNRTPLFMWIAAQHPSLPQDKIKYLLEVMEGDPNTEPIQRIQTAFGATSYQWSAADRDLLPGKKFFWRIKCLDDNGNPFGGNGGQGWNITKWFEVDGNEVAVTLEDVDKLVRDAIKNGTNPDTGKLIEQMKIKNALEPKDLADKIYRQIQSGEATVVGVDIRAQ